MHKGGKVDAVASKPSLETREKPRLTMRCTSTSHSMEKMRDWTVAPREHHDSIKDLGSSAKAICDEVFA